jgi:cardiolipin synthase
MPEWLLPPNVITYVRLLLAPLGALAIADGRPVEGLWLVLVAGISDGLDGFLARQFRWRSRLGSYLDPLADKLLLVLVFFALAIAGSLHWSVLVLFGIRDVWILGMVAFAWARTTVRDFPPRLPGKLTTVFQIALALFLLVENAYPHLSPPGLATLALVLACAASVVSGVDYTVIAWKRYRAYKNSQPGTA